MHTQRARTNCAQIECLSLSASLHRRSLSFHRALETSAQFRRFKFSLMYARKWDSSSCTLRQLSRFCQRGEKSRDHIRVIIRQDLDRLKVHKVHISALLSLTIFSDQKREPSSTRAYGITLIYAAFAHNINLIWWPLSNRKKISRFSETLER